MLTLRIPAKYLDYASSFKHGYFGRSDFYLQDILDIFTNTVIDDERRLQMMKNLSAMRKAYYAGLEHRANTLKGGL